MTTVEVFKKYHAGEADSHILYVPEDLDHVDEYMELSLKRVANYIDSLLGHQNLAKAINSEEKH